MDALFIACQPRPASNHPTLTWAGLAVEDQVRLALGAPCPTEWFFPGTKQKARRAKKNQFQLGVLESSSSFALQICRALREYKKAVAIDLRDSNSDWEAVARSMEWGPDFSDPLSDGEEDELSV